MPTFKSHQAYLTEKLPYCFAIYDSHQMDKSKHLLIRRVKVKISGVDIIGFLVYTCQTKINIEGQQGGVETLPVSGHLGSGEPIVKPASDGRFLFFIKG